MLTQHTRLEERMLYPELEGFSETRLLIDVSTGNTREFVTSLQR